ncbi:ABC transporter substrate-binding protein [Gryllotalpicola koreensis]|uniref:ABC transporter substrate-binding protein n=1 Tax=Gryllotalpicola koreensis TaxID=993086 RepID=A0ABP7ZQQ8_9MICO
MAILASRANVRGWRAVAAVAAAGTVAALLAGCSGGGKSSSSTQATTLTIAASSAPGSFDPTKDSNGGTQTMYQELAYEPLIEKAADGSYAPGLATKWGYVAGQEGKQFELTLRQGAKFADGTAVTAEAVANSLNYFSKNVTGPSAASVKGITAQAEGSDKVLLTAPTPNPIIAELLTPYNLAGNVMSAAGLAKPSALANATFGAGPYVYQPSQSVTGDHYVFTPNKYYYDQKRIHFKEVVIKVISNNTSAMQALRSGQVDVFAGDSTQVSTAKSAGVKIYSGTNGFTGLFIMDWAGKLSPALGNQQVRQALNYAVDRKAIAKAVFGDYGTPTDQPNTPGWDAYDKSLENTYSYDPAKAKQLLKDAGYGNGFSFALVYNSFEPTTAKVVQAVADQLGKVGVTVKLTGASNFSELGTDLSSNKFSALSLGWGGQTQFVNTNQLWVQGASVNPYNNTVPGLPAAFSAYTSSTDADRNAKAQAVQKIIVDQAVSIPVVQSKGLWFASSKLKGFKLDPTGNPNNAADWTLGK